MDEQKLQAHREKVDAARKALKAASSEFLEAVETTDDEMQDAVSMQTEDSDYEIADAEDWDAIVAETVIDLRMMSEDEEDNPKGGNE